MRASKPIEFCPSRSLRAAVIVSFLAFGGFFTRELLVDDSRLWVAAGLGLCTLIGIGGVLETLVAKVRIQDEGVLVRDLFRSRTLAYDQIESVKLEGGRLGLKMNSGQWERLPDWLPYGASMSARHRIAAKLDNSGARLHASKHPFTALS